MKNKICTTCGVNKNITEFNRNKNEKDGRQKQCTSCHKKYYLKYKKDPNKVNKNKQTSKENTLKLKIRNASFINRYLSIYGKCIDCGINNIRVLEFDHTSDDKKYGIRKMIDQCCSIKNIKDEIRKCEIRCCNCHRIKTQNQFEWGYYNITNWIGLEKYQGITNKQEIEKL